MAIYRVYLTSYFGNKLPPFYIGSTTEDRLASGYHGSVRSKKYRTIWEAEQVNNPHLFRTRPIGKKYRSRKRALAAERRLQLALNVVRSPMYANQSVAAKDGCFGRDVSGANHPLFGVGHTTDAKKKIAANHADFSGGKNGRARWMRFTSPDGETFDVFGGFKKFCREQGLPHGSALFLLSGRVFTRGACVGWRCEHL